MGEKQNFAIGDNRIFSRWKNILSCVEKYSFIGIAHFTLIDTTRTLYCKNDEIKWVLRN